MKLEYGPVLIVDFFDENRIGYYDDDSTDGDGNDCAVVFLGEMRLTLHTGHYMVPYCCLREVTTADLWERRELLDRMVGPKLYRVPEKERPPYEERYRALLELTYITRILVDRMHMARFGVKKGKGVCVFISHSSKDKQFARWLSVDLANAGHDPWLDEWKIKVGESIPSKVSDGLQRSDYVLVVLSRNSVKSNWVEREWQAKYWNEVKENNVMVIPVLLEDCEVPYLLQAKKYADFTSDYHGGLEEILSAIYVAKK